jgi:hypothetical protein
MIPQSGIDAVANAANNIGEMAEWSNAAVSKTVVRFTVNRGFESPSLRKAKANHPLPADGFYFTLKQSTVYMGDD